MDKIERQTADLTAENVERLAKLFPNVMTEVREPDGTLRHVVDFDALREQLGDVAEGPRERYQFTWPGKREARAEARRPCTKTLRPVPEKSKDWDTTENLFIEGDNLEALKLLRNTYAGKVKMIYIDPPYNTGHDFIYDDDFAQSREDYDAQSGDYDEEGGRLVANPESNGRFHSDWCSMMYPRLLLARDLLSSDGVIFISIANQEVSSLKSLADEVFAASNCLGIIVWESKTKCQNTLTAKRQLQAKQEYILAYKRKPGRYEFNLEIIQDRTYSEIDESGRRFRYKRIEEMAADGIRGRRTMVFPILGVMPSSGKQWKYGQDFIGLMSERGDLLLRDGVPTLRIRPEDEEAQYDPFWSLIQTKDIGTAESAKKELGKIIGNVGFETVKPVALIRSLVNHVAREEDVVLDFFSGSATTAHAVMKLNAEDGGNRKFIMVQLPEACDEKSEAAKAGYHTICEIGEERIRRAGEKIREEVEAANAQLKLGEEPKKVPDIGFRVLKIDSSNFEDVYATPDDTRQDALFDLADNLKSDRTAADLLFEALPAFQIPFSATIERIDVADSLAFDVDGGALIACFDTGITNDAITAMAKHEPSYCVVRDASFADAAAAANFEQIFKTVSPATACKVI